MLKSKYVWQEQDTVKYEQQGSGIHPEIERLFIERNLGTIDDLKGVTSAEPVWHDPYSFPDMGIAVDRIKQAVESQEKILIYGDYDADGTTATAIMVKALRQLGANVSYYIPHRFFEGYGPNVDAFMNAVSEDYQLIITVDCGISAIEEALFLKDQGVDLIISDHHAIKNDLPEALAILHPEISDDYPFDYLAGAGVALKIAEALKDGQLDDEDYMLAMFGTVGDIVALVDENRTLVKRGLEAFKTTKNFGVIELMRIAEINQYEVDETTVGFAICPRLNAPGRMDDAAVVVDLLLSDDEFMAAEYARMIEELNNERKETTNEIVASAKKKLNQRDLTNLKVVVLHDSNWHEGVLGIVASKIVDLYSVAAVVLTDDEQGFLKGSARAPQGIDILQALTNNESLLLRYGGHTAAAGMTLATKDPKELEHGLNQALKSNEIVQKIDVDMVVDLVDLDLKWLSELERLSPFGQANKRPIVKLTDVLISDVKRIGATGEHLKFMVQNKSHYLEAIFFSGAKKFIYLTPESKFDLLCEVEENEWNGNKKIQLRIIDIACSEIQFLDLRNQKIELEFGPEIKEAFVIDRLYDSKNELLEKYQNAGFQNIVLKSFSNLTMPTREQFGFVYKTIKEHAPFTMNQAIIEFFFKAGIGQAMLTFIIKVFVETELICYNDSTVNRNEVTGKIEFESAQSYKMRSEKVVLSEFLELATPNEILEFLTKS